jgi:hypothetical protein
MILKELVETLSRDPAAGSRSVIERRLRHWTSHAVLRTAGTLFPGQGQSREYDDETIYVAAVLNEIAKYGCPLGTLSGVAATIYHLLANPDLVNDADDRLVDLWRAAQAGAGVVLFVSQRPEGNEGETRLALSLDRMDGTVNPFFPEEEGHSIIVINLRSLFAKLKR